MIPRTSHSRFTVQPEREVVQWSATNWKRLTSSSPARNSGPPIEGCPAPRPACLAPRVARRSRPRVAPIRSSGVSLPRRRFPTDDPVGAGALIGARVERAGVGVCDPARGLAQDRSILVPSADVFLPVPPRRAPPRLGARLIPRSVAIPRNVAPGVDSYKSTACRRNSSLYCLRAMVWIILLPSAHAGFGPCPESGGRSHGLRRYADAGHARGSCHRDGACQRAERLASIRRYIASLHRVPPQNRPSTASAATAAITAGSVVAVAGRDLPSFDAMTTVFWAAAGTSLGASLISVPMLRMEEYAEESDRSGVAGAGSKTTVVHGQVVDPAGRPITKAVVTVLTRDGAPIDWG